jgi:hypothetical protein
VAKGVGEIDHGRGAISTFAVVSQSEVMAFGSGVPISAVAYELTTEVFPSSVGWRWSPG